MAESREKVELHNAAVWTCPECGRDSFLRLVEVEMEQMDVEAMAEEFGPEFGEFIGECEELDGEIAQIGMTRMPDAVTCDHCAERFDVEHVPANEDEDVSED